ncbi:unnamed protein product, partial [Brenthis ino]
MQCYKLSPKREPLEHGFDMEMMGGARRLELPAPPGKEFRAPCLLPAPAPPPPPTHSVIQCMRPPPPPPPPSRLHKPPPFEEPSSSIPDLDNDDITISNADAQ